MPKRWLVDGMNVIGSRADRWWNDPDRAMRRLADELDHFAARSGDEVVVVFDRPPRGDPMEGRNVTVVFARWKGRNAADNEIHRIVSEADRSPDLTVVTSDRRLKERVQELGARVVPAGAFRKRLDDALER